MARFIRRLGPWAVVALALAAGASARAQDGARNNASDSAWNSAPDSTVSDPPVKGSFGLDVRLRDETLHNTLDFSTARNAGPASDSRYFRFRVRASAKAKLRSGAMLCARLTAEPIKYMDPYLAPVRTEVILDNLYLDIPRLPLVPARLRAGRMDLPFGEGLLLMDGGPGDGSRSSYENAVVLDLNTRSLGLAEGTLTLMAIRNLMRDPMVIANDAKRLLVEKDETAFGLHYATERYGARNEILYIYKEETNGEVAAGPPPDARLHTVGYRMSGALPWQLDFAVEGAYQSGTRTDAQTDAELPDQRATGLLGSVSRRFAAPLMPTVSAGAFALSGDDGDTDLYEGWNPLFSRWPMWSELCIFTLIPEQGRVAYWQNLASLHAGARLQVSAGVQIHYTYRRLLALHVLPESRRGTLFGDGLTRGDLHMWRVTARLSRSIGMQFIIERLAPGDFYAQRQDDAYFLRWEATVQK